jgi:hypothetical protein
MKTVITALSAMILVGTLGSVAMAQDEPGYNGDITRREVANFDHYLDRHPEVAERLTSNPRLINDPQFLANHPGLRSFLASHPGVREEIHESPGQFMRREGHYEWVGEKAHPLANTDHYLDQHPKVAQQLQQHPGLVDDPRYVANHPGLREFLATHPVARSEWKSHPNRFTKAENRYDQNH